MINLKIFWFISKYPPFAPRINLSVALLPLQIIEYGEKRLAKDEAKGIDEVQELVGLVLEVLPPPPPRPEDEMQGQEEMPTEKPLEED